MTPAIISIVFRIELKLGISSSYDNLYNHCKQTFMTEVNSGHIVRAGSKNYAQLDLYLKQSIERDIAALVSGLMFNGTAPLPSPVDEAGQLRLMADKILFQIKNADASTDEFSMYLLFHSEPVTLIGTLGDKLFVSAGDKSAEIASKNPIPVFSIKHTSDIWFESYKRT